MTQFLFATESYPFSADINALLSNPNDSAVLITKDVHHSLKVTQRPCLDRIIEVESFDLPHVEHAIVSNVELEPGARIISHDDFFYEIFAEINSRHRLTGYSLNSILPFVNKHIMKQRLEGSGIRCPRYVLFDSVAVSSNCREYIDRLESELGFPMFAKPLQGAGAEQCAMFRTREDLQQWCTDLNSGVAFEIDEFIGDAVLHHCDSVIQGGRVIFTQSSRYSRPCADFALGFTVGSFTLIDDEDVSVELGAFASRVISQFAKSHPVPDGVTHMEVFRKPSGELIFLEVQFRPPGANVKRSYALHLGVNLEEVHFRLQMGQPIDPIVPSGPYTAWMYFPTADGTVGEVNPLPAVKSKVVEADYGVLPGQVTKRPSSILDARGRGVVALSLIIANDNYAQLVDDFLCLCRHRPFTLIPNASDQALAQ